MSYELERSSGIFDQGLFGLADYYGEAVDGLGSTESITSVNPNTRSTAVQALQNDLILMGLLAAGGADGYIGPNTMTALTTALTNLGLPQDAAHLVTRTSGGAITVPDVDLEAIHAVASKQVAAPPITPAGTPAPSAFDPMITTGPGKPSSSTPVSWAPQIAPPPSGDGMLPATTPGLPGAPPPTLTTPSSTKWIPIAVIGGGALLIAGVAFIATRKKSAPSANRRRMTRNAKKKLSKRERRRRAQWGKNTEERLRRVNAEIARIKARMREARIRAGGTQ